MVMDGVGNPGETVEPETIPPETIPPETVEPETVEPEIVEPEIVEPQTVPPETIPPETVPPETVEPQTVEPQTVEPEVDLGNAFKEMRSIYTLIMREVKKLSYRPYLSEEVVATNGENNTQGGFIQAEKKLKLGFKASPPVGERFGEGSKSILQNEKSRLMYFSFFV